MMLTRVSGSFLAKRITYDGAILDFLLVVNSNCSHQASDSEVS
jgi:hypothetical protein